MTWSAAIDGALMLLTVLALWVAGARLAAAAGLDGIERAVAAVVAACAGAVLLVLGLSAVGLGLSRAAVTAACLALAAIVRVATPRPATSQRAELARWLSSLPVPGQLLLAAGAAVPVAWAWVWAREPILGTDALSYHLPEIVMWVQNGRAGSDVVTYYEFPTARYPIANEILLTWPTAVSRSLVPSGIWTGASLVFLTAALVGALRRLGAGTAAVLAAVAAFWGLTLVEQQLTGPNNDLPATAWVAATGLLTLASRADPRVLGFAILSAALAVGTKTTTALPILALLAIAVAPHVRSRALRSAPLALSLAAGVVVGGFSYIRNMLDHGSPLWPFVPAPFGTPSPHLIEDLDNRLLFRLEETLGGLVPEYRYAVAGGVVLFLGALALLFADRRPATRVTAACGVLGVLLYALSPFSGMGVDEAFGRATLVHVNTTRYLLPPLLACVAACAMATTGGRAARVAGFAALAGAVIENARQVHGLPLWWEPLEILAVTVVLAALVLVRRHLPSHAKRAVAGLAAAGLVAAFAAGTEGFARRTTLLTAPDAAHFVKLPEFRGSFDVVVTPFPVGILAGDRLEHRLVTVPEDAPCSAFRPRRDAWVLVGRWETIYPGALTPGWPFSDGTAPACLRGAPAAHARGAYRLYTTRSIP